MPFVIKIRTDDRDNYHVFNTMLRDQMTALHLTERLGGISGDCWVHIGGINIYEFYNQMNYKKYPSVLELDVTNWMKFLGFSRIDGRPMFLIPNGCISDGTPLIDNLREKGITTLNRGAIRAITFKDENMRIELGACVEDDLPGYKKSQKVHKQVFSEMDPYGEEDWDE